MCGIAGFNWSDQRLAEQMALRLAHRGPDASGVWFNADVSLSHRRLSILDLSDRGKQPMIFDGLVTVFNGEIYNFHEIRKELEGLGHVFITTTDTEVILHAYRQWGDECFLKFNGMWALCIYDQKNKSLLLSRDRFGKKPLYYYFDGRKFIFASEIKALRVAPLDLKIDRKGLNFFFFQKYIGNENTFFQQVRKLEPGCNLHMDIVSHKIRIWRYYSLENEIAKQQQLPLKDRLNSIEPLLADAVEQRLIADVPVGSFLSGGVDSSIISALIAQKHNDFKTFSIGFKNKNYDESEYAQRVARHIGTDHHVEYLDINEDLLRNVIQSFDEPFGDSSILPTFLLSQMTRQHVTVAISGDGGDEIFGGYDSYKAYKLARFVPHWSVAAIRRMTCNLMDTHRKLGLKFKIQKFFEDFDLEPQRRHLNWMSTFNDQSRRQLLGESFLPCQDIISCADAGSDLLSVQLNDMHNYLAEDILKKVDAASMMNSLEVRVPFLDHRLVPLVLSLPEEEKIRGLTTKWALKQIAQKYLPRGIVNRPKRGFTVPVAQWLRESDFLKSFIADKSFYRHDLVNYEYVGQLMQEHVQGRRDNARKLWLVFVLNYWWHVNG